jgi:hydrogenase nickel incorporation protein HypA/HybF
MHEFSIAQSVVSEVQKILTENNAKKVSSVHLEIGLCSGVVKSALEFVFPEAAKGTALENCTLTIEEKEIILLCFECGETSQCTDVIMICTHCKSTRVKMQSGSELLIRKVELI